MPRFLIEQYEICMTRYQVEASSEGEAVLNVFNGLAEPVDDVHEYIEVAEDRGLPADKHQQLANELRSLGEPINKIIPSIRTIERID